MNVETRKYAVSSTRQRAVEALCVPELADIVDLVTWVEDHDGEPTAYAANHVGWVRLHPGGRHEVVHGHDPILSEDPMAYLPYPIEIAEPSPATSHENSYPYAAERILSLFADPERSPDLAIVHTPRHFFPDEGGHVGEHGSLDVIQSRAPLILSGKGIRRKRFVDAHARLVDVGPTLAHLSGVPEDRLRDDAGAPLDGSVLRTYLTGESPRAVVGVLWDGAPCGDVLYLAENGRLPNVARLIQRGVALRGGGVAQFPSVTLTNHTSILTGVGPGRHGVLGNVYVDRTTGERVVPNDETTWHRSHEWLREGVRTVFELVREHGPADGRAVVTACIDEAIDRGADYSTMELIRATGAPGGAGSLGDRLPDAATSPYLKDARWLSDSYFRWGVQVDDLGLAQVRELFGEGLQKAPLLTWWANVVTDAGHHGGGPRSAMAREALGQADARLGVLLELLEASGELDEVAFVLTADHGFEGAVPPVTGSWRSALDSLGVAYRDEGPGFVYFGS
ncbi:MAG: alkaline phosphatase family protein [Dermatophilaceae bacterium]